MPGWMSNTHQSGSGIGSSLMATRSSNLLSEHVAASPVHRSNTVSDSPYLAPTESSPQLHGMTIQKYIAPRLSGALDLTASTESKATNQCLNITNRGVNPSAAAALIQSQIAELSKVRKAEQAKLDVARRRIVENEKVLVSMRSEKAIAQSTLDSSSAEAGAEDSDEKSDSHTKCNQQQTPEHKAPRPALADTRALWDPAALREARTGIARRAAEAETAQLLESAFLAAGLAGARGEGIPELRACRYNLSPSQRAANKLQEWLASLDTIRDKLTKYCVHHYWLYHVWSTAVASADTVCCVQAI